MAPEDKYLVFLAEEDVEDLKRWIPRQRQTLQKCLVLIARMARLRSLSPQQRSKISLTLVEPTEWSTESDASFQLRHAALRAMPESAYQWFTSLYKQYGTAAMRYVVAYHRLNSAAIARYLQVVEQEQRGGYEEEESDVQQFSQSVPFRRIVKGVMHNDRGNTGSDD